MWTLNLGYLNKKKTKPKKMQTVAETHKQNGNDFFKQKQFQQAVECYSKALAETDKSKELEFILLNNRATSLFHLGKYKDAERDCDALVMQDSDIHHEQVQKAVYRKMHILLQMNRGLEAADLVSRF